MRFCLAFSAIWILGCGGLATEGQILRKAETLCQYDQLAQFDDTFAPADVGLRELVRDEDLKFLEAEEARIAAETASAVAVTPCPGASPIPPQTIGLKTPTHKECSGYR